MSPEADKANLLARLQAYLREPAHGAVVVFTKDFGDGYEADVDGANVCRAQIRLGAALLCESVIKSLRSCQCPRDHTREIIELEQAGSLMLGTNTKKKTRH